MRTINWDNVKSARDEVRAAGLKRSVTDHRAAAEAIARDLYSWPGGYELVAVTTCGDVLCAECVRKEFRQVYSASAHDGWRIAAVGNATGPDDDSGNIVLDCETACDNCGRNIGEMF